MATITQAAWNSWEEESKFGHDAQMEDLALGRATGTDVVLYFKRTAILRPYLSVLTRDTLAARSVACPLPSYARYAVPLHAIAFSTAQMSHYAPWTDC
jgi:hypothetical protein